MTLKIKHIFQPCRISCMRSGDKTPIKCCLNKFQQPSHIQKQSITNQTHKQCESYCHFSFTRFSNNYYNGQQ